MWVKDNWSRVRVILGWVGMGLVILLAVAFTVAGAFWGND